MSYLNLPSLNLADVENGVISLWFRFSQDSVDKAVEYRSERPHPEAPGILDNTIPLITFGREVMAKLYDFKAKTFTFTVPPPGAGTLTSTVVQVDEQEEEAPCAPSHIGIICRPGGDDNPPITALIMNFQTGTRAQVEGLRSEITNVTWKLDPAGGSYNMHRTIEDVSYILVGEPETFLIIPTFVVEVDHWHHLLVSFDFSTDVKVEALEIKAGDSAPENEDELREKTIRSFCKVWFAFDDVNKIGKENIGDNTGVSFGQTPSGWVPADENGIIPQNAEAAVFTYTATVPAKDSAGNPLDENNVPALPKYEWEASPLVMQDGPMGFPASENYVETVYHCEMAEFQFFSGVTLNTSDEASRRAFIDADGKPVSPDGSPGSIELLGKRPDVLLRGSSKWKNGKNTGSTGTDDAGEEITEGQFTSTALIATYKPNPSLYGPQNARL